jgi:hypothetical protein
MYLIISVLLLNELCFSQTNVYISSDGNDDNCGDYSNPCKTFEKSLETLNKGIGDKNVYFLKLFIIYTLFILVIFNY